MVGEHRSRRRMGDLRGCCPLSTPEQLVRVLSRMLDEDEFLTPYGLRSLSRGTPRPSRS